ncbi:hypothetical protein [Escherichia coli]|uniref:hypothetical protein n=1 Tax=Escherichia coli TaxID=562 RepID=UPI0020352224|nr:hypothetical protein [Escherichia coli]
MAPSVGYSYGNDSSQYNYGVTGGVVIHPHGVTPRNIWATLLRLSMLTEHLA